MTTPLRTKLAGALLGGTLLLGGAAGAYALTGSAGAQEASTTTAAASSTQQSTTQQSTDQQSSTQQSSTQQAPPQGAPSGPNGQAPAQQDPSKGGHQANGITETLLTGDTATKAKAAALEAVPGGTVQRVENDAEGATYEAHVTKADGSQVTVKMDADFKVTSTEDGMK
ncbi:MAG: hypothetical protein U0Q22_14365 [Acidimicrobiales bacterium]